MEGLKNRNITKLVWLPEEKQLLFDAKSQEYLSLESDAFRQILMFIDLDRWTASYSVAYKKWLNEDDMSIYDFNYPVNAVIIDGLIKANRGSEPELLLYWFDVDRTDNEEFVWEYCPLSGRKLINLGEDYPKINSLVSPDFPLIFPGP